MSWQERFRKLIDQKKEAEDKKAKQLDYLAAKERRWEEFAPRIETVCQEFAKAVKWKYSRRKLKFKGRYTDNDIRIERGKPVLVGNRYADWSIYVDLRGDGVGVQILEPGGSDDPHGCGISFEAFIEEWLAKALEERYRIIEEKAAGIHSDDR